MSAATISHAGETRDPSVSSQSLAGKYLTFILQKEVYGVEILKVQEIMGIMPVTQVPRMPAFVRGVINLRGRIIPVIDQRIQFGLPGQDDTAKTCIIVVQVGRGDRKLTIGMIVDEVAEVVDLKGDQIEPPPSFGTSVDTNFILGMGKLAQKVVMLLDIDRVLSREQAGQIEDTAV